MSNQGMGGYVGTSEDKRRILRQQKEREEQRRAFEEARRKAEAAPGLRQFGTGTSEALEHAFKTETVGLVTRDEFLNKRQTIKERLEAEAKRDRDAAEDAAWQERDKARAKRAKAEQKAKLSFQDDLEEEDEEEGADDGPAAAAAAAAAAAPVRKFATLGKDPTVRADFLPDRDRERQEAALREDLRREWEAQQEVLKTQPLDITYSYWNGSGHRRTVTVKQGDTVAGFLKAVLEQLAPQFRELRAASVSSLLYVKEDVILPHTVTFYDLIAKKVQGRSGPLFRFDAQERAATAFDPRVKSQDTHAGKVVERHWYGRHKHIFPYNRWEVYDPDAAPAAAGGDGDKGR